MKNHIALSYYHIMIRMILKIRHIVWNVEWHIKSI